MAKPLPPAKRDLGSNKELFGGLAASLGPRPGAIILNGVLLNSFFPGTGLPSNLTAAERQKITSEQAFDTASSALKIAPKSSMFSVALEDRVVLKAKTTESSRS
jgi:hypothetical protein